MNLFVIPGLSDTIFRTALSAFAHMSVLIAMSAVIAHTALQHRSEARHILWMGVLGWVMISPVAATLADRSGIAIWTFSMPFPVRERTEASVEPKGDGRSQELIDQGRGGVDSNDPHHDAESRQIVADDSRSVTRQPPIAPSNRSADSVLPKPLGSWRGLAEGVILLYMIGLLVGVARIVMGWRRFATFFRHVRPLDPVHHGETLAYVRAALGVTTLPPIVSSPEAREPAAIGLLRPQVVLPEGMAEAILEVSLRHILIHECAHIIRRDPWVGLFQRLAGALYWPHPLVHYMNGRLTQAREEACDDHVLRTSDRFSYARTLLFLTESCRPLGSPRPGLGLIGAKWSLTDRIAGLLDPRRVTMAQTSYRLKIALALALAATGLMATCFRVESPARADDPKTKQTLTQASAKTDPAADAWRVKGVVLDDQGHPVTGAIVRSVPNDGVPDEARTSADGSFALTLAEDRPFIRGVVAESEGGARIGLVRFEWTRDLNANDLIKIVLKPSRTVQVRVKDSAGAPVPGAAVEAIDLSFQVQATTGLEGKAFLRIPADTQIQWVIGKKAGAGFDYFENYRTKPATDFPPLPDEVILTLDGAQTVRLRAIDSKSQPVPGVAFSPWILYKVGKIDRANVGRSLITRATTDREGIATFDWFPKDDTDVTFLLRSGLYTCPKPSRHERGGPTELTMQLLRDTRLSGIVRFPDGHPAPRVLVRAQGSPAGLGKGIVATRTGKDGRYSLDVPPERSYIVSISDENWAGQSLQGIVLREGESQAGLDITLIKGTLLHGQVTEGPDRRPSASAEVSLVEEGGLPPVGLRRGKSGKMQLVRRSITDPQGRYNFRVGPGRYWLMAPPLSGNESLPIEVKAEAEIVRDLVLKGSANETFFNGVVMEKTPAGERPIVKARVFKCGVGTSGGMSLTDAEGRFRMVRTPGEYILYVVAENGMAGFAPLTEKADDVKVVVSQTATVSGRVVDSNGKPLPRHMVGVSLANGEMFFLKSMYFGFGIRTDEKGRFTVKGAPVGSEGELSVFHQKDASSITPRTAVKFQVLDLAPVDVPDLVIPSVKTAK